MCLENGQHNKAMALIEHIHEKQSKQQPTGDSIQNKGAQTTLHFKNIQNNS